MKLKLLIAAGAVFYLPVAAQAAIVNGYGTYACSSTDFSCWTGHSNSDGGERSSSATSAVDTTFISGRTASAQAFSSFSGSTSSYLPTLRVRASADGGGRSYANAFSVQGYSYSGDATTITLDFNLHGSVVHGVSGDLVWETSVRNALQASVAVVFGSSLEWFPAFATLVYEIAVDENPDALAGVDFAYIGSGLNQNASGSIEFDVMGGMDFFVIAALDASSGGGSVDAWNTLSMNFDAASAPGLTASVVPVPAAVWLFGSGLLGLVAIARRRR